MTVIDHALAMLPPEARDLALIEDAAAAQPSVEQQVADHRRQRATEPFAGRRLEAVLRAVDDRFRDPTLEQSAEEMLAAAVLQLERGRHRRREFEQLVIEERLARFEG